MLREDEFITNTNIICHHFFGILRRGSISGHQSKAERYPVTRNYYGDLFTETGPISRLGIATVALNKTTDRVARCATQMVVWLIWLSPVLPRMVEQAYFTL